MIICVLSGQTFKTSLYLLQTIPTMPIRLRRFSLEDYEDVINIWKQCKLSYKPFGRDRRDRIEKEMNRGIAIFILAEDNHEIIGTILGTHDGRKGWINRLAVLPTYRNQGIARKLVKEVEKQLHEIGIDIITCLIEDSNPDSRKVFSQLEYIEYPGMHYLTKRKYPEV